MALVITAVFDEEVEVYVFGAVSAVCVAALPLVTCNTRPLVPAVNPVAAPYCAFTVHTFVPAGVKKDPLNQPAGNAPLAATVPKFSVSYVETAGAVLLILYITSSSSIVMVNKFVLGHAEDT